MLSKEGTYINLSFGMVLYLLKGQTRHSIEIFHNQICNEFDADHTIYSISIPQSHSMYLKVMLQPTPKLFYGMMLFPDGNRFTGSQSSSEDHETFDQRAIKKENQYHFSKRWTFCHLSTDWYAFTPPCRIIQLYVLLMGRKLLLLVVYSENIIALTMNYYLLKTLLCKYASQAVRAIPAIEGDRESAQVNPFFFIHFQHRMEHFLEYIWLGCVSSTLLTHRSNAKWDDPLTYLDSYSDYILSSYNMMMFPRKPAIYESYEFACPVYDSIINTESNSHSGKSRWTFCKGLIYQLFHFGESSEEKQFPEMVNTPRLDSGIYIVFIDAEDLNELVWCEYIKDMSVSQHQHHFNRFLTALLEVIIEKRLKCSNGFANLINHIHLLVGHLAFS